MTLVERLLTRFLRVHDAVYQKTNGRIGRRLPGFAPALLLHTVGAKSGQPRTTSLSYSNDGNDYLIVASKGGDPGLVLQPQEAAERRDQRRAEAVSGHGAHRDAHRSGLRPAVGHRQPEQPQRLPRVSGADQAAHPGRGALAAVAAFR